MEDTNTLIEQRRTKLAALRAQGLDPFRNKFAPSAGCGETRARFESGQLAEGACVAVAGRITSHRDMGKSQFLDLKDQSGRIQVYAQKQVLGETQYAIFKHLDLADFIGVTGTMFRTKTGEPSVRVESFTILAKALRPPPAKWHGLEDTEIRYRQRYLDLMSNDEVKRVFLLRSRILREIREFLHGRGFVEVETPMMQAIPGGAAARPFKTHHNALGCDFYLRIAIELYLKRLLVGGIDRVFEIGRNFRNEGLSRKHNPEFTMLEAYQAFADYESMMDLVQGLVCHVSQNVLGTLRIEHRNSAGDIVRAIDLTPPWRRVRYKDIVRECAGADWFALAPDRRRVRAIELGAQIAPEYEDFEVTQAVFEKLIEPTLINPTFVTHAPKELIPLAKLSPEDPTTVEVFECCINGQEIAPAYTEQNDPIEQRERLEHQAGGEQQKIDEDFLVALEHGMPPAGGMGLGIDRLCMMLLGQESIRDVILFPQLKPKES
ncbi:MAG TPA: lysine--tRNA ligase [Verrucomicrobiota bacterium]|nr:lysine--tRNA ligase [Verrucomicrobiota bacterium]HOR70220.1 lysine--tRNA ligase [Verrucomicrobiota bacterium]HOU86571.1 lysine--tRNA ligase [Verrucomicrobiota bacterium]HPK96890.1 lysine--tRNA ligase [Verrucomicrobiota bacterium]HQF58177.1 lysine--tRNA ligase [Verrucomicrobiota bacterium]